MRDLVDANCARKCGDSGAGSARGVKDLEAMLDAARRLISPSARSDVPAFMVMDVMAAAARIEAAGGRVSRDRDRGRARGTRIRAAALYRDARHADAARAHCAALP